MTIAERLQLSEEQRSALFYALLLKDAGCSSNAWKVTALFGADDFGVKKNLKTVNWSRLSQALQYVARTVSVAPFRSIAEVAASHHEKLDGSGYHRGVSAEDLNLPSRILAVADVFDALSQDRPYRPAMPMEKVLTILKKESGQKLSPECVEALEDLVSKGEL